MSARARLGVARATPEQEQELRRARAVRLRLIDALKSVDHVLTQCAREGRMPKRTYDTATAHLNTALDLAEFGTLPPCVELTPEIKLVDTITEDPKEPKELKESDGGYSTATPDVHAWDVEPPLLKSALSADEQQYDVDLVMPVFRVSSR